MRKNIDLGASFEKMKQANSFPGNPMEIHRIQDDLCALQGDDNFLKVVIRSTAGKDIDGAIKLVLSGYNDNPEMVTETIGAKLMDEILQFVKDRKEYLPQHPEDDIPEDLFIQPGVFGYCAD